MADRDRGKRRVGAAVVGYRQTVAQRPAQFERLGVGAQRVRGQSALDPGEVVGVGQAEPGRRRWWVGQAAVVALGGGVARDPGLGR